MDITMATLVALASVALNQLLNFGKAMFQKGKDAQRIDTMEQHKTAVDSAIKTLKDDVDKKFDDMHQRPSRHQREYIETLDKFSDKLSSLLERSAKIEGSMEAINMIAQQMVREHGSRT